MLRPGDFNLRHLGAIAVAARSGSISSAAEAVHLSQPSLAQAIGRVERRLGEPLFERQPTGVVPTPAGELLATRIERALAYVAEGGNGLRRGARLPVLPQVERRITLGQLRAVIEVDRAGSFALAASREGVSQPALHRAARELEELLEVPLLVRQGRTVRPTRAAAAFLRYARLAVAELAAGLQELDALRRQGAGRVALGVMPLARAVLLPRALARFARTFPEAAVQVVEGPYDELLAGLRDGTLDLLVGAMREPLPIGDVVQEAMFVDEPVVVGRSGHPLSGGVPVFERLLDFPWVIPLVGTPVRTRWERMFRDRGVDPPPLRFECGSVLVLRGLLLEDDWLTLMSRDQFFLERRAGLLAEIGQPIATLRRQIGITIRGDWRPTALQAAFIDLFRSICADQTSANAMGGQPFRYG